MFGWFKKREALVVKQEDYVVDKTLGKSKEFEKLSDVEKTIYEKIQEPCSVQLDFAYVDVAFNYENFTILITSDSKYGKDKCYYLYFRNDNHCPNHRFSSLLNNIARPILTKLEEDAINAKKIANDQKIIDLLNGAKKLPIVKKKGAK